eukprot:Lithocolla_globosa_v1_NODE_1348_length_2647_cov_12.946373.p4 type:complete len:107 gc:universal NODE_1348_length_2647_cov_12.946373:1982-1662(-)
MNQGEPTSGPSTALTNCSFQEDEPIRYRSILIVKSAATLSESFFILSSPSMVMKAVWKLPISQFCGLEIVSVKCSSFSYASLSMILIRSFFSVSPLSNSMVPLVSS